MCFDGVKRLCHIRGKMRKKVWVAQGDIVLIGLRDYQDGKADVIQKYMPDEARNLKSYGEFPESVKINETVTFGEDAMMMKLNSTRSRLTKKMKMTQLLTSNIWLLNTFLFSFTYL